MKRIALTAAVASFAFVAGCQSTAPPAVGADNVSPATYPPVTATGGLNRLIKDSPATVDRSQAGAMTVQVPVRVVRDKEVPIEYRFTFFDERNRPLRPESDWQYKVLPPRTQQFLVGTALDQDAYDWRLEMRPAR